MKFLTILATVFCGGTVWVTADFFVEFRAPPMVQNLRGQQLMTQYLYECKGVPNPQKAFIVTRSQCTRVTDLRQKVEIYYACNFYNVRNPNRQGHVIAIPGHHTTPVTWNLGFYNHDIDHPNFAEPHPLEVASFNARVQDLGVDDIVPSYLVETLASYFAMTNVVDFARDPVNANVVFSRFVPLLRRLIDRDAAINRVTNRSHATIMRHQFDAPMRFVLQKMIDPCAILTDNLQPFASRYCATYCDLMSVASRHFGTCGSKCSELDGGRCQGAVCNCNRVLTNPFAGCDDPVSAPMQFCLNSMREEMNL